MCGIAGWIGPDRGWDAETFREGLRRRGPDGSGIWRGTGATLVHTRLAILGLGEEGAQPMVRGGGQRAKGRGAKEHGSESALSGSDEKLTFFATEGERASKLDEDEKLTFFATERECEVTREGDEGDEKLTFFATERKCEATCEGDDGDEKLTFFATDNGQRTALVFNGEIYNYRELRAGLEAEGETFLGNSDTEVLLRLLECEGAECLPRLAGMFAFCLYDEETGEALLARDAFGIKPLYYRIDGETLAFASTASLLGRPGDQPDAEALEDYLRWGSVPEPATLHREIREVPAGHFLKFCQATGETVLGRWHGAKPRGMGFQPMHSTPGCQSAEATPSLDEGRFGSHREVLGSSASGQRCMGWKPMLPSSESEAAVILREALLESVGRHLVSDVPVGIFLSGGIDSTAVLALAREVLGPGADLRTFSIGFDDAEYDESSTACRTAEHFGARHTEWRMTEADGLAEIPAFLTAMDQPTLDGFNTWCVSRLAAREGMKVVLSGLGGDEWFAGYGSFERVPQFRSWHGRLGPARPLAAGLLSLAPAGSRWRRLGEFFASPGSWLDAFHAQRGIFTRAEAKVLARALLGEASPRPLFAGMEWEPRGRTSREEVSALELGRYLRNQLLRDSDVFSMANGLELRVPFVDVRLAEALESLPPEERLRPGKALLLEALPEIPVWVREQPKRGFRFPFQEWMEGGFGERLAGGDELSAVPMKTWYRLWTASVAKNVSFSREAARN